MFPDSLFSVPRFTVFCSLIPPFLSCSLTLLFFPVMYSTFFINPHSPFSLLLHNSLFILSPSPLHGSSLPTRHNWEWHKWCMESCPGVGHCQPAGDILWCCHNLSSTLPPTARSPHCFPHSSWQRACPATCFIPKLSNFGPY